MATTRVLASFLFGVTRADGWTYAAIMIAVGIVGVAATLVPAHRATQVDPIIALRE
jgi:ABC-type antimicrobial peptide transport system permease subunit